VTSPKPHALYLEGEPAPGWLRSHRQVLVDRAITALAERSSAGEPEPGRVHDPQLRWIVGHNIDLFVRFLESGGPLEEGDAPDLVASAARRASEGSAIEELLHDYQVGIGAVWQAAVDLAAPNQVSDLVELTASVQTYLLQTTRLVLRGFQHEASRISLGERDARFALYSALLNGEDPEAAAQHSGLRLGTAYLVLRLRLQPDPEADELAEVQGRDARVSEHRRANTVQRVLASHTQGQVLALVRDPIGTALVPVDSAEPAAARARCLAMADQLIDELGTDVHVAAALALPAEVPAAMALTDEVLELAVAMSAPAGAHFLEDLLVAYQLTRPGPGRDLLEKQMRPLDGHPEWEETLRAYVRHGYDRRATASALHLHPNTVDYRLGRIAAACGVDPSRADERATFFAAICVRDLALHRSTPALATTE
jgi:hypothetical protein